MFRLDFTFVFGFLICIFMSIETLNANESSNPLILTPYIESKRIVEARKLSEVKNLTESNNNVMSFSGFLTVKKKYNSNLFFWFFPSQENPQKSPVMLWLQGGPGASSLFGLFVENGPFQILDKNLTLSLRNYTLTKEASMLYIDNPVGTGFSFTDHDDGFVKNQSDVADDLFEALRQFFILFEDYKSNDFYIIGESYAGKYIPSIAYKLHEMRKESGINMKGIAIGNGWIDPITMLNNGDYLYQIGLIDEIQLQHFLDIQNKTAQLIKKNDFETAFRIMDELLNGDLINTTSYFTNATGMTNYFNILHTSEDESSGYFGKYLNLSKTRNAIHVGAVPYADVNITVEIKLIKDEYQSVKPWFEVIVDNYKVMLYSGQLDIIVGTTLTENFIKSLKWKHSKEYPNAKRIVWKVTPQDKEVSGYVKHIGDFYFVVIRNAGHMVPHDQPRVAFHLMKKFINSQSFEKS